MAYSNDSPLSTTCIPSWWFVVLATANFNDRVIGERLLSSINQRYPEAPEAVMEFWTGWFDRWGEPHHVTDIQGKYMYTQLHGLIIHWNSCMSQLFKNNLYSLIRLCWNSCMSQLFKKQSLLSDKVVLKFLYVPIGQKQSLLSDKVVLKFLYVPIVQKQSLLSDKVVLKFMYVPIVQKQSLLSNMVGWNSCMSQ